MAYSDYVLRISFWDDEVDSIEEIDSIDFKIELSMTAKHEERSNPYESI